MKQRSEARDEKHMNVTHTHTPHRTSTIHAAARGRNTWSELEGGQGSRTGKSNKRNKEEGKRKRRQELKKNRAKASREKQRRQ